MRRERQDLSEIIASLTPIEASWRDSHSDAVVALIETLPERGSYSSDDLRAMLAQDFDAALTVFRLALDLSKDEFVAALRERLPTGAKGVRRIREDASFVAALVGLDVPARFAALVNTPVTWRTLLVERLKAGRGSAIKGQARGRELENFVEQIVRDVFGAEYHCRCRFIGARGESTEKCDFAIPSREDPQILIEVKAYGATGSKQTDVLGDVARIVEQKRHDTAFLLVTDGTTWRTRVNDLRKLVDMQHQGLIARIYTRAMKDALQADLTALKQSHQI